MGACVQVDGAAVHCLHTPPAHKLCLQALPETGSPRHKYFLMLLCAFNFCFRNLWQSDVRTPTPNNTKSLTS